MGERSARKFLDGLEASKQRELWRLLFGLGIFHVGAGAAKALSRHFKTLDEILTAGQEELTRVDEIGDVIAKSIIDWSADPRNRRLVDRLRQAGLHFQAEPRQASASGPFVGKTIVLTGTLPSMTRKVATARIEAMGGKVSSSISQKTDYVLAGADAGLKLERARQLNVPVLDEAGFRRMADG
jgi:DNA ligase (NAD+)